MATKLKDAKDPTEVIDWIVGKTVKYVRYDNEHQILDIEFDLGQSLLIGTSLLLKGSKK